MTAQPDPPLTGRRAKTRAALIGAAQELLSEGRTAVSIQGITDRAGVGFGSFYNFFATKEELWEAAVAATVREFAELRDVAVADLDDPAEVFAASFRLSGRMRRAVPEQVRVLLHAGTGILGRDEGLAPRALADIQAGIDQGCFDIENARLGLMIVGGALLGLLQMLDDDPSLDDAVVSDQVAERLLRALGLSPDQARDVVSRPLPELPTG